MFLPLDSVTVFFVIYDSNPVIFNHCAAAQVCLERSSGVPWEINRFYLIDPKKNMTPVTANNKSLLGVCVVVTSRAIKYSSK